MKKTIFISMVAIAISAIFTLSSCQKEETNPQENVPVAKTCYAPRFRNKTMTYTCTLGNSCATSPLSPFNKMPRMNWRVGSDCASDSYTDPAYYYVYEYTGTSGGYYQYVKIDQFTCSGTNIWYAGTPIQYNKTYILVADISGNTYPTNMMEDTWGNIYSTGGGSLSQSDVWKFSTGASPLIPC